MNARIATAALLVLAVLLMPLTFQRAAAGVRAQTRAEAILQQLSPEERVGQVFLVSLGGADTGPDSAIRDLIVNFHVGGVVLSRSNDNFLGAPQTVEGAHNLISRLQRLEWEATHPPSGVGGTGAPAGQSYLPLLVGISQEGDGYPHDQILSGLTPLPSAMALGATWSPELSADVARVQARELAALGINLYFGPSLDVVETPNAAASGDLGSGVFGGDPYWVGAIGQAYVRGLHEGSQGRMLVVPKHFPGRGGSDRRSEIEVSTVRKSLEQLKQIELAPFFTVAPAEPGSPSVADGLLVSHIRYQGFQGNIRATTKPVSFDPQALGAILGLPEFATWRSGGGLMVSDDLGTAAVRDFYSAGGSTFSAKTVAREAFLAGNDLLYLGNIASQDDAPDAYEAVVAVLESFAQKYREDAAFAQRVNAAALRIIDAKLRLYPGNTISGVTPERAALRVIGTGIQQTFEVAQGAATIISPGQNELTAVLPDPPLRRDRLVFIIDVEGVQQCSSCLAAHEPSVDAFEQAVLSLYGPAADDQTSSYLVSSYSLDELAAVLEGNHPPYIEADLDRANWIIISMAGSEEGQAQIVSRFLRERQQLLAERNVVVFSFGAPYYFDATDISRMTAYYALFSKQPPFFDIAARLLYQEQNPAGASPVSISAVGYELITMMTPDPSQLIRLSLDVKQPVATPQAATPEPTPIPLFRIGDTISVRTGAILDHNGHPVPDGTVVQFTMVLTGEGGGILQQFEAVTTHGIARTAFGLEKPGLLEIRARSEPANLSEVLQLDVSQTGSVAVTVVVPEVTTAVGAPTPPQPASTPEGQADATGAEPRLGTWLIAMAMLAAAAAVAFYIGERTESRRAGQRWALGLALGGLVAYDLVALGLPGVEAWSAATGPSGVVGVVALGGIAGVVLAVLWPRSL